MLVAFLHKEDKHSLFMKSLMVRVLFKPLPEDAVSFLAFQVIANDFAASVTDWLVPVYFHAVLGGQCYERRARFRRS